jgi:hypothetical protein
MLTARVPQVENGWFSQMNFIISDAWNNLSSSEATRFKVAWISHQ